MCILNIFEAFSRLSLRLRPKAAGCYIPQVYHLEIGECVVCALFTEGCKDKCEQAVCYTIRWACSACCVS